MYSAAMPLPALPTYASQIKTLAWQLVARGAYGMFALGVDVAAFAVPLFLLARKDEIYGTAGQLIDMAQLITIALIDYCLLFNTAFKIGKDGRLPAETELEVMERNKRENAEIFMQVFYFSTKASLLGAALFVIAGFGIFPSLGLRPESVKIAQDFLVLAIIGRIFNFFERTQQQFFLSTSKKDDDNPYIQKSFLKINWRHIAPVVSLLSLAIQIIYIKLTEADSNPWNMAAAYGLAKLVSMVCYSLILKSSEFLKNVKFGHNEDVSNKISKYGWQMMGITLLQIFFPVLQSYALGSFLGDEELAFFGVISFVFNIGYVLGLGWHFSNVTVVTENKEKLGIKMPSLISTGLQLGVAACYLLPFVVAFPSAISIYTQSANLAAKVQSSMLPLSLWILTAAASLGATTALRADGTNESVTRLLTARFVAQWVFGFITTATILASGGGVSAILWANVLGGVIFDAGLVQRVMAYQRAADSAPASVAMAASATEASSGLSAVELRELMDKPCGAAESGMHFDGELSPRGIRCA